MDSTARERPVHGGYPGRGRREWMPAANYKTFHEPGAVAALAGAAELEWVGRAYMQTQEFDAQTTADQLAEDGWRLVRA